LKSLYFVKIRFPAAFEDNCMLKANELAGIIQGKNYEIQPT
jgi:hypothetical protein